MAASLYFNNFGASQEQLLIENLIIESIKIYGLDCYYLPRTVVNRDDIYSEPEFSTFNNAILMEMYIKNVDGFEGDGEFLSKFGIEVRDQITFTISQRVFEEEITSYTSELRPQEGALIYFPLTNRVYQIKYVNKKPIFYQLGALQTYDIVCELFEYSNEVFDTGLAVIDDTYNELSTNSDPYSILTQSGNNLVTESGANLLLETYDIDDIDSMAQNEEFEQEGLDFIDFTEIDPFSEGSRT